MTITYNLAFTRTNANGTPGPQQLVGPNDGGVLITGSQKLVERFVCRLLTSLGSIPYLPLQGCTFLDNLSITGMFTEADIFTSFAAAMLNLSPSLQAEESTSDPDDERFASAKLLQVVVMTNTLLLNIQVNSLAGGSTNTQLPISFSLK